MMDDVARSALGALLLVGLAAPAPALAQAAPAEGWYALSAERGWTEVYVVSPALEVCLVSTSGCEDLEDEPTATLARDAAGVPTTLVVTDAQGTRVLALEPALARTRAVAQALLTQCFYAEFADDPLDVCASERDARQVLATASRLLAALGPGSPFELTDAAITISGTDDDELANAADLAVRAALAGPSRAIEDALVRLHRDDFVRMRDGSTAVPELPAPLRRALDASLAVWLDEAEADHTCDSTCGGCIPLSDRYFRAERTGARAALEAYARALDDALWARGISVWTLTDADLAGLLRRVGRGAVETACGRSSWPRASFRRCATAALETLAHDAARSAP